MRQSKQIVRTAYHEAGHAVIAWHERIRVNSATIIQDRDTLGRVCHRNPLRGIDLAWDNSLRAQDRAEKLIRVCLAGEEAERLAFPKGRIFIGDESDHQDAVDLLARLTGSTGELEAYWNLLLVQTRQLLARPHIWPLVEAVAAALLSRQRLSGAEVRAVIIDASKKEVGSASEK